MHLIGHGSSTRETAHPGQDAKLTYDWRCDDALEDGWLLFTHTNDLGSGNMGNLYCVGPLREERNTTHQVLGPERWETGKVSDDEQTYKVYAPMTGTEGEFLTVGIWEGRRAAAHRERVPTIGDNSAIVGDPQDVGIAPKTADEHTQNDVPALTANKLASNAKITIDGKLNDAGMGVAASIPALSSTWGTVSRTPRLLVSIGSAKGLWDAKNALRLVHR